MRAKDGLRPAPTMTDADRKPDFAEVYDRHFSRVYNYVRWRVPGTAAAEDVVSRVFESALDAWDGYDPRRAPADAWLFAIARRGVADHFRAAGRAGLPLEAAGERAEDAPRADEILEKDEDLRALAAALGVLDEREREVLALKFGAGMKHEAIAAHLELSADNVGVIAFRAAKKLKTAMEMGR
ncbi:MAG: sigma-70 family RNA polymerase sigma factor [Elusimicrobia bacterium]|nr:sigma-70 family RNA polymerase sigma factor [Elusimicrobiota bacterium]